MRQSPLPTEVLVSSSVPPNPPPDPIVAEAEFACLEREVAAYRDHLLNHPIAAICARGELPLEIAHEYARIQYVDSVLWIPMLALIKAKAATSSRLRQAVRANILCEAGYDGIPHVELARLFVESLGQPSFYGDYQTYAPRAAHPVEVMNGLAGMSEAELAGWLFVAETLVPPFFQIFRPVFAAIPGADLRYLDEHITVDADEHSEWMKESVQELLRTPGNFTAIRNGIRIGGRLLLSILDVLYARSVRMGVA